MSNPLVAGHLTWKVKMEVGWSNNHDWLRLDPSRPQEPFPSTAHSTLNAAWGIKSTKGSSGAALHFITMPSTLPSSSMECRVFTNRLSSKAGDEVETTDALHSASLPVQQADVLSLSFFCRKSSTFKGGRARRTLSLNISVMNTISSSRWEVVPSAGPVQHSTGQLSTGGWSWLVLTTGLIVSQYSHH